MFFVGYMRSYPTYEEWKHEEEVILKVWKYGSYPTYEEWKHWWSCIIANFNDKVLILPMRNGN